MRVWSCNYHMAYCSMCLHMLISHVSKLQLMHPIFIVHTMSHFAYLFLCSEHNMHHWHGHPLDNIRHGSLSYIAQTRS